MELNKYAIVVDYQECQLKHKIHISRKDCNYVDSLSSFVGGMACYNGNIAVSQMLWGDTTGTFAYTYDSMNRLVESRSECVAELFKMYQELTK